MGDVVGNGQMLIYTSLQGSHEKVLISTSTAQYIPADGIDSTLRSSGRRSKNGYRII